MALEITGLWELNRMLFAFTAGKVKRLTQTQIYHSNTVDGSGQYVRPRILPWHNMLFFAGATFTPRIFDRNGLLETTSGPMGHHAALFRDHLVVGHITGYNGAEYKNRVMFSDLRKFSVWDDRTDNEAAYYDFDMYTSNLTNAEGVTGIAPFGTGLLVYTPRTIDLITYTGLQQGVYNRQRLFSEIGSAFHYGVVGNERINFFISENNIYALEPDKMPEPIGTPVIEYIKEHLTEDPELIQRTWGFYDQHNHEVGWCFYSKDSNLCDRMVLFNLRDGSWYCDHVEDIHSFTPAKVDNVYTAIDDLQGSIDGLSGTIDKLSTTILGRARKVWGSSGNNIYADWQVGQLMVPDKLPFLVSKDFHFNNLSSIKEIYDLTLQANFDKSTALGVECYVSTRSFLDDPVEWTFVGLWTDGLRHKLLSFPSLRGRIVRFKFIPRPKNPAQGVRDFSVSAWSFTYYHKDSTRDTDISSKSDRKA